MAGEDGGTQRRALARRAVIRDATPDDAEAIAAIYRPLVRDTVISFEIEPPNAATIAERIAATLADYPYLVATPDGEVAGYAYGGRHRPRAAYRYAADVSVYVAADARQCGIGRALYGELLRRLDSLGFHTALAGITMPNPASVALHQSYGFTLVGTFREVGYKFGRWHDVAWFQRPLALAQGSNEGMSG